MIRSTLVGEIRAPNLQSPYRTVGRNILSCTVGEEPDIAPLQREHRGMRVDHAQMNSDIVRSEHKLQ